VRRWPTRGTEKCSSLVESMRFLVLFMEGRCFLQGHYARLGFFAGFSIRSVVLSSFPLLYSFGCPPKGGRLCSMAFSDFLAISGLNLFFSIFFSEFAGMYGFRRLLSTFRP